LRAAELRAAEYRGTLVVGGEQLRGPLVARWARIAPRSRVVNEYGPTETTVGCTVHTVALADHAGDVPIGHEVPGTTVEVLDAHGRDVRTWAPGEIAVGGDQVAHGYLGRPSHTAERFVPDPARPGARRYRTGDRARRRFDGTLEYLG